VGACLFFGQAARGVRGQREARRVGRRPPTIEVEDAHAATDPSPVEELIGRALPNPVTDFMALPATLRIPSLTKELCVSCGNCARCPYLAITLDEKGFPHTDPSLCIGCSICAKKCFTGAITMRARTPEEIAMLVEN